jgi:peptidoglycan-associated lipoprotein
MLQPVINVIMQTDTTLNKASTRKMEHVGMIRSGTVTCMKRIVLQLGLIAVCVGSIGCNRDGRQCWEDARTSQRYMTRGVQALFGKHGDSKQVADAQSFYGSPGQGGEFVAMKRDEALYAGLMGGDSQALAALDANTPIPASKLSPGDPGSGIPGIDGFQEPTGELANIFKLVHFLYNEHNLTGEQNFQIIERVASYMKDHPNMYLFVEGHCDERGPDAYNLSLGSRRANTIRNLLVQQGIHLDRIFTISYGKERPMVSNHDESGWSANRRGAFKVFER